MDQNNLTRKTRHLGHNGESKKRVGEIVEEVELKFEISRGKLPLMKAQFWRIINKELLKKEAAPSYC